MKSAVMIWRLTVFLFISCKTHAVMSSAQLARRVIRGRDARPGEFPYVMQIVLLPNATYPNKILSSCTGAAIAPTWILTARHCTMYGITPKNNDKVVGITYGSPDSKPRENTKFSLVLDIFTVPYRPPKESQLPVLSHHIILQDIALLKTEPILIDKYARVSSIDFTALYGHEVTMTGYGKMLVDGEPTTAYAAKKPLQILEKALLIRCDKKNKNPLGFGAPFIVYPQMCVAYRCNSVETVYSGDSGGPIIHASGVVGVNVGLTDYFLIRLYDHMKNIVRPSITFITPTSPYVDWIASIIEVHSGKVK